LFLGRRTEAEMDEELRFHIAEQADLNIAAGQSPEDALRAARIQFVGLEQQKERCRDARKAHWLDQVVADVRFAVTGTRRNPLFSALVVATLTLGITAITTVFSIVDAVLLRPSSFIHPDSIVRIEQRKDLQSWQPVPPSVYATLQNRHDLFEKVAAVRRGTFTVTRVPAPDQVFGQMVTGNLFSLLATKPLYGRTLESRDELASAPSVMLLGFHAWRQLFSGDPKVVGKIAEVDGQLTTVVGVMPEQFVMPGRPAELWMPLRLTAAELSNPNAAWVDIVARLKPSSTVAGTEAALNTVAASWNREHSSDKEKLKLRDTLWHAEDRPTRDIILWLALGMVAGLLMIGCANVSSLLLARGLTRRRDYAIRMATGATHGRIIRQSFIEILLLALTGLLFALGISAGIIHFLRESLNVTALGIPDIAHARIDIRIIGFSFAVSLMCAVLSACLPAWSAPPWGLSEGLRESGTQSATGYRVRRLMFGLVGIEAGTCMALLLISGLLVSSLVRLKNDDHGIRADHVLTMRLPFGSWFHSARTPEERLRQTRRYLNLLDRVRSVHGVESAALSSSLPLSNVNVTTVLPTPSGTARADNGRIGVRTLAVTGNYFRVMGIPLIAGHSFERTNGSVPTKVVLVNQAFVDLYFRDANPVGRFIRGEDGSSSEQIIGVIRNTAQVDLDRPAEPELYLSFENTLLTPFLTGLVVRTASAPEAISPALRTVLSEEDPLQPVVKVRTLEALVHDNISLSRSSAWILATFAMIALALASAGIYGVVAYATTGRRRDFGIRLCLGSTPYRVFRIATGQALLPVFIGALAGLGIAYLAGRAISGVLYKTGTFDSVSGLTSLLVLLVITFIASAIPALRSARIDPASMLRAD